MEKQRLKEILIDQKETYINQNYVERNYNLDANINYCFVGIRRCGKSYLMYQLIHKVVNSGINQDRIAYVNFQDERLLEFTYSDFDKLLEIAIELSSDKGQPYLFLDEIQVIDNWDKFVRRIADMKYHVSVTGSNSKMLSSEIASTLGGRFMILNVYPYSFYEYLKANGIEKIDEILSTKNRANITNLFDKYLKFGGFPEFINIDNKKEYLNNIYQTIYLGDIIARNKLENSFVLRLIIKKIAESIMKPISYTRVFNIIKSSGADIGKQTVINYVGYSLDALLIFNIQNYAAKLVEKETLPKYYFMDQGLLNILGVQDPLTAQLENTVAIELIRRFGKENVYYFDKNTEIDFYIPGENTAIQVSYSIDDSETYERETSALTRFKTYYSNTRCLILTMSEEKQITIDGVNIEIIPVWKWLLKNKYKQES